jgi:hypothetical protein
MSERWYPPNVTTDAERIEFLWSQLETAVQHLREKDASEAAIAKRFEAAYAQKIQTLERRIKEFLREKRAAESDGRPTLREAMDRAMRRKPS